MVIEEIRAKVAQTCRMGDWIIYLHKNIKAEKWLNKGKWFGTCSHPMEHLSINWDQRNRLKVAPRLIGFWLLEIRPLDPLQPGLTLRDHLWKRRICRLSNQSHFFRKQISHVNHVNNLFSWMSVFQPLVIYIISLDFARQLPSMKLTYPLKIGRATKGRLIFQASMFRGEPLDLGRVV